MANSIEVKINANFTNGGTAGWVSWERLERILRAVGELRDNESINGYRAGKEGITFYVDNQGVEHNYIEPE